MEIFKEGKMYRGNWNFLLGNFLVVVGLVSLPLINGCGSNSTSQGSGGGTEGLPVNGKVEASAAPTKAAIGMIYVNTTTKKEYIYDGREWVPHSKEIDTYYKSRPVLYAATGTSEAATGDSCSAYDCNPGGAHRKHSSYNCTSCHMMHGNQRFDPLGPAVSQPTASNPTPPKPGFNPIDKSCSNIACHSVPAGTFNYYFPGGDGELALNTVSYGGTAAAATPSWYANGAGCGSCHGNPPSNYVWHSGRHATNISGANECQFCHPDATGSGGIGTTITNTTLHKNGTVEVQARFTSKCFGCH
jgi:hypothetical protein